MLGKLLLIKHNEYSSPEKDVTAAHAGSYDSIWYKCVILVLCQGEGRKQTNKSIQFIFAFRSLEYVHFNNVCGNTGPVFQPSYKWPILQFEFELGKVFGFADQMDTPLHSSDSISLYCKNVSWWSVTSSALRNDSIHCYLFSGYYVPSTKCLAYAKSLLNPHNSLLG